MKKEMTPVSQYSLEDFQAAASEMRVAEINEALNGIKLELEPLEERLDHLTQMKQTKDRSGIYDYRVESPELKRQILKLQAQAYMLVLERNKRIDARKKESA